MSNHTRWLACDERQFGKGLLQAGMIVSLNFLDAPAEASPFVCERFQCQGRGDRCQALDLVVINNRDEVLQLMVSRKQNGFPVRTLVTFAIAEQHKYSMPGTLQLRGVGHSSTNWQSMSQRSSRQFDTGN